MVRAKSDTHILKEYKCSEKSYVNFIFVLFVVTYSSFSENNDI